MSADLNWEEIAQGTLPDDDAFSRMSRDEQLAGLDQGVRWTAAHHSEAPPGCYRVAKVVLHLLDAHGLSDEGMRASAGLALGVAAAALGRANEAILQFRHVLEQPPSARTEQSQLLAAVNLTNQLVQTEPEAALRLSRQALAMARRAGYRDVAANICISLGSLLKRAGDLDGARRVYGQAMPDAEAAGDPLVVASLHGNLGNLLSDDLGRHHDAIPHYQIAISQFDAAGAPALAARRCFHLIETALQAGEFDLALHAMEQYWDKLRLAPEDFTRVLERMGSLLGPADARPRWEELFGQILDAPDSGLDAQTQAALVAVCLMLRSVAEDTAGVLGLAQDARLRQLANPSLEKLVMLPIASACEKTGRPGIVWPLRWLTKTLPAESRVALKASYIQEQATLWLAEQVDRVLRRAATESDAARAATQGPAIHGLAAVPHDPPPWLNMHDPVARAVFSRLRAAVSPSGEQVRAELGTTIKRITDPGGRPNIVARREAIRLADLLGGPQLQVHTRCFLAEALQLSEPSQSRFGECLELLREAEALAEGLALEEVIVLLNLGDVLKELNIGDEAARLDEAIAGLRRALTIAREEALAAQLPKVVLGLANAIAEHPLRDEGSLTEAEQLLREGLILLDKADPSEQTAIQGTLYNSLGLVQQKLAEFDSRQQRLIAAAECYERALAIRKGEGDKGRELRTLGNLLAVKLRLRSYESGTSDEEILNLIHQVRTTAPLAHDLLNRASVLFNVVTALKLSGYREAMAVGRDVVEELRPAGATRSFITACIGVGSAHLRFGDSLTARRIFEEGIAALASFRSEGGDSRYRASLGKDFQALYSGLVTALEQSGAPSEEIWWAVERGMGQTLVENMKMRGIIGDPSREAVIAGLEQNLREGTLVLQLYTTIESEVAALLIRTRAGKLDIRCSARKIPMSEWAKGVGGRIDTDRALIPVLEPRHSLEFDRQLSWIGRRFLEPLLIEGGLSDLSRIVFVAESDFRAIAWHAVPLPEQGAALGDIAEVVEVPSASILTKLLGDSYRPVKRALLIACDPGRTLRHHMEEVRQAFSTLQVDHAVVLTDQSRPVTSDAVLAELSEVDLIHFSGHGMLIPGHPEQSGLLLSDGLLSVQTLEREFTRRSPSIVVLSACDSASDEVGLSDAPSLSTVFLQAGARVVIGSLWPVPDDVAADTAQGFYARVSAMGPVKALNETRRHLERSYRPPKKPYWGSFKIFGWD